MDTMTRQQLLAAGMTPRMIARRVHDGRLIRVRRGHYATPQVDDATQRAVRVGGRLACVTELRNRGVWVLDDDRVHVHVPANAARLRSPDDRHVRRRPDDECHVHWGPLLDPGGATASHVSARDALAQALGCLDRRAAQASVDSAVRLGVVRRSDIARIARERPGLEPLRADPSAESGLETIVREVVRELGLAVTTQVWFAPEIRVDMLIEGWVVVETDGAEFHDATVTTKDRRRDAYLASRGRTVLHFRYAQVVFELPSVTAAIIAAVESHRRVRNSGPKARRARRRAEKLGLT